MLANRIRCDPYSSSRQLIKLAGSLAILPTHRALLRQVCRRLEGIGDFREGLVVLGKGMGDTRCGTGMRNSLAGYNAWFRMDSIVKLMSGETALGGE